MGIQDRERTRRSITLGENYLVQWRWVHNAFGTKKGSHKIKDCRLKGKQSQTEFLKTVALLKVQGHFESNLVSNPGKGIGSIDEVLTKMERFAHVWKSEVPDC